MGSPAAILAEHRARNAKPGPELVTSAPAPLADLEQIPLLRILEIVGDRVESIHASQRAVTAELREIKANLPAQRRPLSTRSQEIPVRATWARRNGFCPCSQVEPVFTESERLEGAEFDHWYSRKQNRVTQTWLVCHECSSRLIDTDFKATERSAFEAYQRALRPFMGARQIPLILPATDAPSRIRPEVASIFVASVGLNESHAGAAPVGHLRFSSEEMVAALTGPRSAPLRINSSTRRNRPQNLT